MATKQQHKKQVSLPTLDEMGPIFVAATRNIDKVEAIADAQRTFGGLARARLMASRSEGRRSVLVMLRYTSYRVVQGELPGEIAEALYAKIRWLAFLNRAATCAAEIESDSASPRYLGVWLNPERIRPENS